MKFNEMQYSRVSLDELKEQINKLTARVKEAKSGEELYRIHKEFNEQISESDTNLILCSIRHDINVQDTYYKEENEYCNDIEPLLQDIQTTYYKELVQSKHCSYIKEKIGPAAMEMIENRIKGFDESLIPLMQEENKLVARYDEIIAGATVDWNGEELNLARLLKYQLDTDRNIRKKAYQISSNCLAEKAEEIEHIYDKLIKNRTKQARMLGLDSYIQLGCYRLNRVGYTYKQEKLFRNEVKEAFVPLTVKIVEQRIKRMGLDSFHIYDHGMAFPNGDPTPDGTPEDIFAAGKEMYHQLSEETKEFIDLMLENDLFDVLAKKNKKAGGYMTYLYKYNVPFIFGSFSGTSDDIYLIAHECGHAFQGYVAGKEENLEQTWLTNATAETHSMSMEFFTEPWMNLFFKERAEDYNKKHFEDSIMMIPYICLLSEFEETCYEAPDMTIKERNELWIRLNKEYRPFMDYDGIEYYEQGNDWIKILHFFMCPIYCFDYAVSQVCAFQFKARMDQEYKSAWESYLTFCKKSNSDYFITMLKDAGLEDPFKEGTIKQLAEALKSQLI